MKQSSISKKQWAVIAALVGAGLVGGVAIMRTDSSKPAAEQGHADEHGEHEDAEKDAHGHGSKAGSQQQAHKDEHDHEHEGEEASGKAKAAGDRNGHGQEATPGGTGAAAVASAPQGKSQSERIAMTDEQVKAAGITMEAAGRATIRTTLQLPGQIGFNEDRTAHIVPRVAGVVDSVRADLGQSVRRGQVLAVISSPAVSEMRSGLQAATKRAQLARATYEREKKLWEEKISPLQDVQQAEQVLREAEIAVANASQQLQAVGAAADAGSLNRFELRAPFDGIIVEKHISLGEAVREDASVFTLSDLSTVWAGIDVPGRDIDRVRVGSKVTVRSSASEQAATGTVSYLGSLLGEQTRTAKARVTLGNPQGAWRPGLFVTVELVTGEAPAAMTVPADAVQQFEDKPTVFVQVPGGFLAQPVETGRSDGQRVEILRGLQPGATVAAQGSFVLKSEAGKGSASHTH